MSRYTFSLSSETYFEIDASAPEDAYRKAKAWADQVFAEAENGFPVLPRVGATLGGRIRVWADYEATPELQDVSE